MQTKSNSASSSTYLVVPMLIFFALLIFAAIRGPNLISGAGIGSAVIVVAPLILATYALTIIVMAGRAGVDLSIGPLIGFINVSMIQLYAAGFMESPIAFFLYAMGVGAAYQILQGLIIIFVRVQPIIVSLSGYLTLVGLNLIIMPRPGGVAPDWMFPWGSGTTLFSAVLVILVLATIGWYLIAQTAFFVHLRLMGSDERAAYTSGVHINWVRLGAHVIGGLFAGLAAITFTSLISSGDPTQGTTYTLMAVTALVLGGANLAGGRGSAFGSLLGALNIYLITYVLSTFNFGKVQSFVTDLAYGVMLVVSLLISVGVPLLQKRMRHLSPVMIFVVMAVVALGVIMHTTMDQTIPPLVGVSASAALQSATSLGESATAVAQGYSPGTYILFVVIGVVGVVAVFRQLFKHTNAPMIAFVVVLGIIALGLIFNPDRTVESTDAGSVQSSSIATKVASPHFFVMETTTGNVRIADGVSTTTRVVITITGIVLLASLIIVLMLPQVDQRTKRVAMFMFAIAIALVAIGALFFDSFDRGYLTSNYSGEIYAVILVGVALFTLTAPLVHTKLSNISNVFITLSGVLALICVYFLTSLDQVQSVDGQLESKANYAAPVFDIDRASKVAVKIDEVKLGRKNVESSEPRTSMSIYSSVAYSAIIVVLLHIFLYAAMGRASFESFWRYWQIPVFAALIWSALFYATGVPLWHIVAVVGIAILSGPNVMHIIRTYLTRQRDGVAMTGHSG